MAAKKRRPGLEFEEAVYRFAKTLDPKAEVLFNHSVPDRDTGEPRQCDVWINAKFGGHWPLSILVSCKDHKRKLHSGNIGTFRDEVWSTGASTGVIYSRAGFTKPALRKAQANGYSCCRIYQNEPADIPASICFEHFSCSPRIRLALLTEVPRSTLKTWQDIFILRQGESTILDGICMAVREVEEQAVRRTRSTGAFPPDWSRDLTFLPDRYGEPIRMRVLCTWKKYRARLEATLLNGSYCLNDSSFVGSQSGPSLDTQGEHPGEAWTEVTDSDFAIPTNSVLAILYRGNVKEALQKKLGPLPFHQ